MFAAETELDLIAERRCELDERRNAVIGDLSLQKLPLAEIVGKSQRSVAHKVENVPEYRTISIEDDATLEGGGGGRDFSLSLD